MGSVAVDVIVVFFVNTYDPSLLRMPAFAYEMSCISSPVMEVVKFVCICSLGGAVNGVYA